MTCWEINTAPNLASQSMGATPKSATILERCLVAPPADDEVAEQTLPLTFFDVIYLHRLHLHHPVKRLLFYQFPCSSTHFQETIVPGFKQSLSLTLKHFLPLAGNLIHPLDSGMPTLRYLPGDSVSFTIAEWSEASDFNYLTANHPRDADEFHAFCTELPPPETEPESGFKMIPLLTVQITLFPGTGICIGFNNHHVVGDASSIVGFIKAWSFIATLGGDDELLDANRSLLPLYDRSVINDPAGRLLGILWNQMNQCKIESSPQNLPTNKVRATYVLQRKDIQKLKNLVQAKKPGLLHLSSFTVTSACVWTCLAKSDAEAGEEVDEDEPEYFAFSADARQRTDPPVPEAYFGNCQGLAVVESTHSELKGDDGFLIAAELIGKEISQKVNKEEEVLKNAESWISMFEALMGKRVFGVTGSPKFDLYDADFGWGIPEKYESVSIDEKRIVSLCKSREFEGGLEIGLSLPKNKMDAFAAAFSSLLD